MIKLPITNEIVSCLISSGMNDEIKNKMKESPKMFLQQLLKTTFSAEFKVEMVENSKDTIHLGLPYYAQVDRIKKLRSSYLWRFTNQLKKIFLFGRTNKYA